MAQIPESRQVRPYISAEAIAARVADLAAEIAVELPRGQTVVLVGPLKGVVPFLADLGRALHAWNVELHYDFLRLSSYGSETLSSGTVRLEQDLFHPVEGRHVLLVDDIVDSGRTMAFAIEHIRGKKPASIRTAALLDKPSGREVDVEVDHVGFKIPDAFIVGYGTDYAERFRQLPYVGVLDAEPSTGR